MNVCSVNKLKKLSERGSKGYYTIIAIRHSGKWGPRTGVTMGENLHVVPDIVVHRLLQTCQP